MGRRFGALAIAAGVATGTVGGALLGAPMLSGAQDSGSSPAPDASAADDEQGARRRGPLAQALANLVTNETLTQAQADAVQAEVARLAPAHRPGHHVAKIALETAAATLQMELEALRTELRNGKTLAQVADEKGVAVDTLVDALVAEATKRIDGAVADGRLTEAQGTQLKSGLEERITTAVNDGFRHGRGQRHGHGRGHGPRGARPGGPPPGDGGPAAAPTSTSSAAASA